MDKAQYLKLLYHAQLVKHWHEVKDTVKDKYNPSQSWIVQNKYDGVYVNLVVEAGKTLAISRSGLSFNQETQEFFSDRATSFFNQEFVDGVYVLELCNPYLTLEELSGIINPNRTKPLSSEARKTLYTGSYFYIHDYISLQEYKQGSSPSDYITRYLHLCNIIKRDYVVSYILVDVSEIEQCAKSAIEEGAEGIVIKAPYAGWKAGFRGWHAMKIVRECTMDLRCIACEFGKGKREGQIAALIFKYKGGTFKADLGKGYTDSERQGLTKEYNKDPNSILGIWEIKGLQESSTGKAMRLPKVVRPRFDKTIADDEV